MNSSSLEIPNQEKDNYENELVKIAKYFIANYKVLCTVQIRKSIESDRKSGFLEVSQNEICDILEVPNLEPGVFMVSKYLISKGSKIVGRIPVNYLYIDDSTANVYMTVLDIYLQYPKLLVGFLTSNPNSKIVEMFRSRGLLSDCIEKCIEYEKESKKDLESIISSYTSVYLIFREIRSLENSRLFLDDFVLFIMSLLDNYPRVSKSPRSEDDLLELCSKERQLLREFYVDCAEQGIHYIFSSEISKPFEMQSIFKVFYEYASLENNVDFLGKLLFNQFVIPKLFKPGDIVPVKTPRTPKENPLSPKQFSRRSSDIFNGRLSKEHSPRDISPRNEETSDTERKRFSLNLSPLFSRFKQGKSTHKTYILDEEEIKVFLSAIGNIYIELTLNPIHSEEYPVQYNKGRSLKHLTFIIERSIRNFFEPMSDRTLSTNDYYHEISEIYPKILEDLKDSGYEEDRDILMRRYGLRVKYSEIEHAQNYINRQKIN